MHIGVAAGDANGGTGGELRGEKVALIDAGDAGEADGGGIGVGGSEGFHAEPLVGFGFRGEEGEPRFCHEARVLRIGSIGVGMAANDETLQAWSAGQSGELRFSTLAAGKEDGAFSGGVNDGMAAAL